MEKHNNNESAAEADGYADTLTDNSFGSSSGSDSDESNTSLLERNSILFDKFMLPKDLCETEAIFEEFFSPLLWESLPPSARQHLTKLLPLSAEERSSSTKVVHDLLSHRLDRFGVDQMTLFQHNLAEGNYRTDIAKLRRNLGKSVRKDRKMLELQRSARLAQKMVLAREATLLAELQMNGCSAMAHPMAVNFAYHNRWGRQLQHTPELEKCRQFAKKRYLSEIVSVSESVGLPLSVSDEEDCRDAIPVGPARKQRRMFGAGPHVSSEHMHHQQRHGQQHANGAVLGSNSKRGVAHSSGSGSGANVFDGTTFVTPKLFLVTDEHYQRLLFQYRKRKVEEPEHPELDLDGLKLKDVVSRTQIAAGYRRILPLPKVYLTAAKADTTLHEGEKMKMLKPIKANRISFERDDLKHAVHSVSTLVKTEEAATKVEPLDDSSLDLKDEQMSTTTVDELDTKAMFFPSISALCMEEKSDTTPTASTMASLVSSSVVPKEENLTTSPTKLAHPSPVAPPAEMMTESIKEESINSLVGNDTHACFLSVVRDLFCSNPDHRSTIEELQVRLEVWLKSSVAARNSWYHEYQRFGEWHAILQSAVQFLAGDFHHQPEDFVPYIEHKVALNILQWIGASRDGDGRLVPLCAYWQTRKEEMGMAPVGLQSQIANMPEYTNLSSLVGPIGSAPGSTLGASTGGVLLSSKSKNKSSVNSKLLLLSSNSSSSSSSSLSSISSVTTNSDGNSMLTEIPPTAASMGTACSSQDDDGSVSERSVSPPPPRFPTDWSVRKATEDEVHSFREQEKMRYENPHLAFTYRQHLYDSVVGPVKGIYTQVPGISKARGHSMLVADRPNFVTILTLVRDATARLPNGEGTRADICELLKSSQYISPTATDQILQTIVSGALDRMHTEHDPCVKYEAKRKIWIYLHRNRTEEEFERLHLQYQGFTKHKKTVTRKPVKCYKENVISAAKLAKHTPMETSVSPDNLNTAKLIHELDNIDSSNSMTNVTNILDTTGPSGNAANTTASIVTSAGSASSIRPATSLLKKQSKPVLPNTSLLGTDRKAIETTCSGSSPARKLLPSVTIHLDQSKQPLPSAQPQSHLVSSDTTTELAMKIPTKTSGAVTLVTSTGTSVKTIKIPKSSFPLATKPGNVFGSETISATGVLPENSTSVDTVTPSYISIPQKNVLVSAYVSSAKSTPGTVISTTTSSNTKLLTDVLRKVPSMPIVVQSSTPSVHSSLIEGDKKVLPGSSMLSIRQLNNTSGTIVASPTTVSSSAINEQSPSVVSSQMILQSKALQLPLTSGTIVSSTGANVIHAGAKTSTTFVGTQSVKPVFTMTTGPTHSKPISVSSSILSQSSPSSIASPGSSSIAQRIVVSAATGGYTQANSGIPTGVVVKPSGIVASITGSTPTAKVIPTTSTTTHRIIRPANLISTITLAKGQQSVLTPAQQKQILQNLLCQQHKQQVLTAKKIVPAVGGATSSTSAGLPSLSGTVDTRLAGNGASASVLQQNQPSVGTVSMFKLQQHLNSNQTIKALSNQIVKITPARVTGVATSSVLSSNTVSATTSTMSAISPMATHIPAGVKMMKVHQSNILTSTGCHTMLTPGTISPGNMVAVSAASSPTTTMRVLKTATGGTKVIKPGIPGTPSPQASITQHAIAKLRKDGSAPVLSKVTVSPNVNTGQLIPLESLLQKQGITTTTTSSSGVGSTFLKITGTSKTGHPQFLQFSTNTTNASGTQASSNISPINAVSSGGHQYTVLTQNARNIISVTPSTAVSTTRPTNLPVTIVSSLASESNDGLKSAASTHTSSTTSVGSGASILSHATAPGKLHSANKIKLFTSTNSLHSPAVATVGLNQQLGGTVMNPKKPMATTTVVSGASGEFLNAKIIGVRNVTAAKMKGNSSLSLMNAANLNIAHIGGKPIIIANNSAMSANPSSVTVSPAGFNSNNILHTGVTTGSTMLLASNTNYNNMLQIEQGAKEKNTMNTSSTAAGETSTGNSGNASVVTNQLGHPQTQTLMLGNQLVKVQTIQAATAGKLTQQKRHPTLCDSTGKPRETNSAPSTIITTAGGCTVVQKQLSTGGNVVSATSNTPKSITMSSAALSKSQVKIQPSNSGTSSNTPTKILEMSQPKSQAQSQRVVLATTSSGQLLTQPIILPSGFQSSGPINIKRLKVIPVSKPNKP